MRRAAVIFLVVFAPFAVAAAGVRWRAAPAGGTAVLADGPGGPAPPVLHGYTPADFARFVTAYPEGRGGRAAAVAHLIQNHAHHARPIDLYRLTLPADPAAAAEAFRALALVALHQAGGLAGRRDVPGSVAPLDELVNAHRQVARGDPALPFYEAYLLFRDGRYADADARLAAAPAPPPGREPELALGLRTAVWAEWGRWQEPGGPPPPPGVTWEAVFWHLRAAGRAADADRALARWADTVPADDPRLARARMHAAADRNDYAGCLAAADRCIAAGDAVDRPAARQHRVLALAYLGRFAEADRELERLDGTGQFMFANDLDLLIALLSGDEARAERVFASGWLGYSNHALDHPRLGPLLAADRWADLRRRHPPAVRP